MNIDSSDDEVGINQLCSIENDGLIRSSSSINFPIRFTNDSFVIHVLDNILMVYMNPMFIWRLIFSKKNLVDYEKEFDFQKLKMCVMRLGPYVYIKNKEIEYSLDNVINHKPSLRIYDLLYVSHGRIYMTIRRGFDQTDAVKNFLDNYMLLLRHISDS